VSLVNDLPERVIQLQRERECLLEALQRIVKEGDYTAPEGMTRIAKEAIAKVTSTERSGS
jgi:hypothetical protein